MIDTRRNAVAGEAVDTPYPVPHNIALTPNGKALCVTHCVGTGDKVTVHRMKGRSRRLGERAANAVATGWPASGSESGDPDVR